MMVDYAISRYQLCSVREHNSLSWQRARARNAMAAYPNHTDNSIPSGVTILTNMRCRTCPPSMSLLVGIYGHRTSIECSLLLALFAFLPGSYQVLEQVVSLMALESTHIKPDITLLAGKESSNGFNCYLEDL